jgi:hypothetical protein
MCRTDARKGLLWPARTPSHAVKSCRAGQSPRRVDRAVDLLGRQVVKQVVAESCQPPGEGDRLNIPMYTSRLRS